MSSSYITLRKHITGIDSQVKWCMDTLNWSPLSHCAEAKLKNVADITLQLITLFFFSYSTLILQSKLFQKKIELLFDPNYKNRDSPRNATTLYRSRQTETFSFSTTHFFFCTQWHFYVGGWGRGLRHDHLIWVLHSEWPTSWSALMLYHFKHAWMSHFKMNSPFIPKFENASLGFSENCFFLLISHVLFETVNLKICG